METKVRISRALQPKGKYYSCLFPGVTFWLIICRFGWVNASYVYGLQIVTAHMKRALGAVTTWDTFKKMTEAGNAHEAAHILDQAREHDKDADKVHVAEHVRHAALPHSHVDETGHKAVHGTEERKEHQAPDVVKHDHS